MPPTKVNSNLAGLSSKLQIGGNGALQAKYGLNGGTAPVNTGPSTGVKAKAPGGVVSSNPNKIKSTYQAPASQQNAVSNTNSGSFGQYKGVDITPGSQQDIQAQMAKIDSQQAPQIQSAPNQSVGTGYPVGSMQSLIANTKTPTSYADLNKSLTQNSLTGSPAANVAAQGLLRTGQTGSTQGQNYANQTAQYGAGNLKIGQQAQDIANQYGQRIADVGGQGAAFQSGQLTTGTSPVAQGNAAITAQTTAAQQQALAQGEQAALQGIGYQLTGQNQAATAANSAAAQSLANTGLQQTGYNEAGGLGIQGQNLLQSGLTSATGFAQPQQGSIGTVTYNPADTTQQNLLGNNVPGGLGGAAALQGGYNAALSNAEQSGTAQTSAYNNVYQTATNNAATTAQLQTQIRSVGQQALDLMKNNPSINQFALQFGNKTINSLQAQLSNPQYAAFGAAVQALQARIGMALQVGEIPTAATANAQAIANGNITLGALGSTLSQVDSELSAFNESQNALANYAKGQMQGGGGGSSSDPLGLGIS